MRCIYLSFVCLMMASCSNQDVSSVLPPVADSVMVDVLIELHLAEARVEEFHEDQPTVKDSILTHYALSRETFESIMAFYKAHPDVYHKIYSEALDKMSDERFLPGRE